MNRRALLAGMAAAALAPAAAPVMPRFSVPPGWAVSRTGVGRYRITFPEPLPLGQRAVVTWTTTSAKDVQVSLMNEER